MVRIQEKRETDGRLVNKYYFTLKECDIMRKWIDDQHATFDLVANRFYVSPGTLRNWVTGVAGMYDEDYERIMKLKIEGIQPCGSSS